MKSLDVLLILILLKTNIFKNKRKERYMKLDVPYRMIGNVTYDLVQKARWGC